MHALNAVAVGVFAVNTAAVVGVKEVVIGVVLVRLPLHEGVADAARHKEQHKAKRVVVDAKRLQRVVRVGSMRGPWADRLFMVDSSEVRLA